MPGWKVAQGAEGRPCVQQSWTLKDEPSAVALAAMVAKVASDEGHSESLTLTHKGAEVVAQLCTKSLGASSVGGQADGRAEGRVLHRSNNTSLGTWEGASVRWHHRAKQTLLFGVRPLTERRCQLACGGHPTQCTRFTVPLRARLLPIPAGGLTENDFIVASKINDLNLADLLPKRKQRFWA